ncbi:MAG: DJ-1 family glyoxalase III [Mangrovibacterium sp.]
MTKKIAIFLAEGFEETEAIATIDLLRRAGLAVCVFSITGDLKVKGANQISIFADELFEAFSPEEFRMIILPGGMPGTLNLQKSDPLMQLVLQFAKQRKWLAAICAAPLIFGELGLLKGREATCYPGFEDRLHGATLAVKKKVVIADRIITSRGIGTVIPFALTIIANLVGEEKADEIEKGIVYLG